MKYGTFTTGALLGGAVAAGVLVMAPIATAVTPETAALSFDCGSFGSGTATLTATQDGTAATISVSTSAIKSPIAISENSVTSTLNLTKNGSGTATFAYNPTRPSLPGAMCRPAR